MYLQPFLLGFLNQVITETTNSRKTKTPEAPSLNDHICVSDMIIIMMITSIYSRNANVNVLAFVMICDSISRLSI